MNVPSFLQHFRSVVNARKGITRIRELVIELAVTGRLQSPANSTSLVQHDYENEPSSKDLPPKWRLLNFGKFFDIQGGNQPPKSRFIPTSQPGYVRLFQIRDLGENGVPTFIPIDSTNRFCQSGDILIGRYGASVGKVFWAQDGAYNVALAKFIYPEKAYLPSFTFMMLRSSVFQRVVLNISRSAQAGFNKGDLVGINFPLPPREEQKRIVAKVDELMRLCDRLEAQQQERETLLPLLSRANQQRLAEESTEANLQAIFSEPGLVSPDELGNSICSLAASGRIVSPLIDDDDVSKVLSKYDIDAVDPPDAPLLPKHWKWVRLGDATTTMNSGWSPACPPMPANPDQWGVLKTTAVQTLEYLEHENKVLPSILKPQPEAEVHDGDILLTRAGPSNRVGIICVARPTRPKLMISDKIIRLHLIKEILPDFGALILNTGYTSACIAKLKSGMAASQMNISQPKLRSVPIPVPPVSEQRLILERVAQLLTLVRRLADHKRKRSEISEAFAKAAIAAITSTEFMDNDRMKPPKTEVVTALKVGSKPKKSEAAPLATLLSEQENQSSAKILWQISGLEIDAFYRQLKTEMANGWIEEDKAKRDVNEVEVS